MDEAKKFLKSGFGLFSVLCIVISFLIAGIGNTIAAISLDAIGLLFLILINEGIMHSKKKSEVMVLFFCLAFIMAALVYFAFKVDSLYEPRVRFAMNVFLFHLMATCFVCLGRGIRRYSNRDIYTERKSSETAEMWNDEEDLTPVISIAEGLCDVMVKRGLERFLMHDYTTSTFLSFGDFANRETTYWKLNIMMRDILSFLELPDFVKLSIEYDSDTKNGQYQAGSYSRNADTRVISLKLQDAYGPNNAAAILCHECTHYFMEHHNLNWSDTELNEQRTDIAANVIGFNRIMIEGYEQVRDVKIKGNVQTTTTYKIGYITKKDCEDLWRFLVHYRKELTAKKEAERQLSERRSEFVKHLEAAKSLAGYLELVNLSSVNASTPEQLVELQRVLMEKETRDISSELRRYEGVLNKQLTLQQMENELHSLGRLCEDLSRWLRVIYGQ